MKILIQSALTGTATLCTAAVGIGSIIADSPRAALVSFLLASALGYITVKTNDKIKQTIG